MFKTQRTFISRILGVAGLLILAGGARAPLKANDWPGYLGPNRDGRSGEQDLLTSWPADGPEILWRQKIGAGYSSTVIAGGRLFTLFADGGEDHMAAFDALTGEELWRTAIGRKRSDAYGPGPRSTPTTDGDTVYALGSFADLAAVDAATGEIRWRHDLRKEMKARVPNWGVASSPILEGDLLIVQAGGSKKRAYAAFDKHSGRLAWASGQDLPAYASPITATIGGIRQVVFFSATRISGVAIDDGRVLWHAPWVTKFDVNAATPIFVPDSGILVSSGYDTGSALLQVVTEGDRQRVYQVWRNKVMSPHFNSAVRVDGYVYGFDDIVLKCINVLSGEEKWRGRAGSKGSLIHADDMLIVLGGQGRVRLVKADPEAYETLADAQVLRERTWAAPSLSDGVLYIRGFTEMAAVRLAAP